MHWKLFCFCLLTYIQDGCMLILLATYTTASKRNMKRPKSGAFLLLRLSIIHAYLLNTVPTRSLD